VWDLLFRAKHLFVAAMNMFETKLRRAGGGLIGFLSSPCPGADLLLRAKDLLIAATALSWPAVVAPARNSTTSRVKIALEFAVI
jgi:hypothetical protein